MSKSLKILPIDLLNEYVKNFSATTKNGFENLTDSELSVDNFSFYTSVSAVFSSKIEGENIELDSFIKHKKLAVKFKSDYTRKIDDLYDAYLFAQKNTLNKKNLLKAHSFVTKNILQKSQQGKFRAGIMYVITDSGKIEYVAAAPQMVENEMKKLFSDIETLLKTDLTFEEVFFFAAMLHLVFVKIHPFGDGNGRTARLLEKWFIAQKLGEKSWFIQSERYYYDNYQQYYNTIRKLGLEYDELNYAEAMPFLKLLLQSVG